MLEERIRRVSEQLLTDSSLTDNMEDAEANRLIEWGLAVARRLCEETSGMDDAGAEEYLDAMMGKLRRTMRRIDKLVGSLAYGGASGEVSGRLRRVFDAAADLPVLALSAPDDIENIGQAIEAMPPDAALGRVLSYLSLPEAPPDETSGESPPEEGEDVAALEQNPLLLASGLEVPSAGSDSPPSSGLPEESPLDETTPDEDGGNE
ncbi:MAG TPA: hypothetical protein ENI95_11140 [Chloroflexi bacterium]|nr:hypothetical protein [Chloroflexota bacterium]